MGDLDPALRLARESLAMAEAVGAERVKADAWSTIGSAEVELGNHDVAREALARSLELFRSLAIEWRIAGQLANLGNLAMADADYAEAARFFDECLEVAERLQDDGVVAQATSNLGIVHLQMGDVQQAQAPLRRSLRLMGQLGWGEGAIYGLIGLAAVYADDEPERAATLAGAAEALRDEFGLALQVVERGIAERTSAALRSRLGSEELEAAEARGRSMSLADAVEYALAS